MRHEGVLQVQHGGLDALLGPALNHALHHGALDEIHLRRHLDVTLPVLNAPDGIAKL